MARRDFTDPATLLRLSQSGLATKGKCAKMYAYKYVEGLLPKVSKPHFDVGSVTSQVLEALFEPGPTPGPEAADDLAARAHELAHEIGIKPHPDERSTPKRKVHRAGLAAAALARAVCTHPYLRGSRIVAREATYTEPFDPADYGAILLSKPDIEFILADGRYLILDYKTSSGEVRAHRYQLDLQAHVYALVYALGEAANLEAEIAEVADVTPCETAQLKVHLGPQARPLDEPVVHWIDTTPGGHSADGIDPERWGSAVENTRQEITRHAREVRSGQYPRTLNGHGSACYGCDYRDLCEAEVNGDTERAATERRKLDPDAAPEEPTVTDADLDGLF